MVALVAKATSTVLTANVEAKLADIISYNVNYTATNRDGKKIVNTIIVWTRVPTDVKDTAKALLSSGGYKDIVLGEYAPTA